MKRLQTRVGRAEAAETFADVQGLAYIHCLRGPPCLLSDTTESIHTFVSRYANVLTAGQGKSCVDARGKMSAYQKPPA